MAELHAAYAEEVAARLREAGFRAKSDLRNEKISYKIREHSLQKLPYQLVLGDKEMQAETVAVRTRGGEDLGAMSLDSFIARLRSEAKALGTACSAKSATVTKVSLCAWANTSSSGRLAMVPSGFRISQISYVTVYVPAGVPGATFTAPVAGFSVTFGFVVAVCVSTTVASVAGAPFSVSLICAIRRSRSARSSVLRLEAPPGR